MRPVPRVGARVSVAYLAASQPGTIDAVADGGREIIVRMDSGELLSFRLSRATGRFTRGGLQTGERLRFGTEDDG